MPLTPGTRFGNYDVVAPIGAGGMGEVYRARDARLQRDVALKVLPETLAHDHERLARLEREAQMLAAVNHPNIASIHGIEEAGGVRALALEFVDGPTLADRIAHGALPPDEALPIARQIASALEAAHEAGIVHRDLKPANIKVRPDGTVKVLDFGLAKAVEARHGYGGTASMSPTLTTPAMTGIGTILGTAAYMAPEQARGRAVDKRADIWAFGCVLYEMLTGRRAFDGSDVTDVLASVIKSDPDWTALPADTPPAIRTTLQRCLQKDAGQRFRDIGDVRLALDGAFHTAATVVAAPPTHRPAAHRVLVPAAAAVLLAAVTGTGVWWSMRPAPPGVVRLAVPHPAPEAIGGPLNDVAISPDGQTIAYLASAGGQAKLYVRRLDQLASTPLLSDRTNLGAVLMSPDGGWIGVGDGADRSFKRVAASGGPALSMAALPPNINVASAVWAADDAIVLGSQGGPLTRIGIGGAATPEAISTLDRKGGEVGHLFPHALPGGTALLFTVATGNFELENMAIAVLDLATRRHRVVLRGGSAPSYSPTGHLLYSASGTLRAVRFDLETQSVSGTPVAVVENVATKSNGAASYAVSQSGTLAYIAGSVASQRRTIVWVDRQGREEPIAVPARAYAYARISPDGARIALDVRDEGNDIWTWDMARQTFTRLTFETGLNRAPIWSPDGRRLTFTATREGKEEIHAQAADGSGTSERLTGGDETRLPTAYSRDGRWLVFNQPGTAPYDIGVVDLQGDRKPVLLLREAYSESNPVISPDGRWLAYQSDEAGRPEIYVRPFPNVNTGRWQVSANGGTRPLWSRDGRELFYFTAPGSVFAAAIDTAAATFSAGTPRELFKGAFLAPQTGRMYDVTPDGKRFLMIKEARAEGDAPPPPQLVVVQHWFEELKRLVPPR